jgi:hypothetical protein
MPKIKKSDFEKRLLEVFQGLEVEKGHCNVCGVKCRPFNALEEEEFNEEYREKPLNKKHVDTYRKGYEFMVKDKIWGHLSKYKDKVKFKLMNGKIVNFDEDLYICMECFEREILTRYNKIFKSRETNEYGNYEINEGDLEMSNPVNMDYDYFDDLVQSAKHEELPPGMTSHEVDTAFDD